MGYTITARKYMGRTMWMITAIYTVVIIALGATVSPLWLIGLSLLITPFMMLIIDAMNRDKSIEVSDEELVFNKCAIKSGGFRVKYHDKLKISRAEIKSAIILPLSSGNMALVIETTQDDDVVTVMSSLFKNKDMDALCTLLNGEDVPPEYTAKMITRKMWIWGSVLFIALIALGLYISWPKSASNANDIACVGNTTEHTITLKMVTSDSIAKPWEVTIPPMSTITLKDDLHLSISSSSLSSVSKFLLERWPRSYIKDTMYVVYDDSITIPHFYTRDSNRVYHFFPSKSFYNNTLWSQTQLKDHIKLEFTFQVKDYKEAVEYCNPKKDKK